MFEYLSPRFSRSEFPEWILETVAKVQVPVHLLLPVVLRIATKCERERNKDYHLVIGTIGETNGGLNDTIPTKIERNVYPEPL